ncbi:SAM-dependent methyltransferase [Lentzea chajnantorensis]
MPAPELPGVDVSIPSAARVYDYLLGGGHNFASDRLLVEKIMKVQPGVARIARENRAFMRRAVLFMVENGVRQFLDLGSGIPTVGNVHEIAQSEAPDSRVVYVDRDPVAVSHNQLLLAGNDYTAIVAADVTHVDDVLDAEPARLLDFTQPVGLLAITTAHFIAPEADPRALFARYRNALPAGSFFALTHLTDDFDFIRGEEIVSTMKTSCDHVFPRTRDEVLALFSGYELVEPGLVTTSSWRPDGEPTGEQDTEQDGLYAGVARRP